MTKDKEYVAVGDLTAEVATTLKERGEKYGEALPLFRHTAKRFSLVLGHDIDAETVARLLVELKLARRDCGDTGKDSYLDGAGYLDIAFHLKENDAEI
jgi:hypothetical protein